MKKRILALLSVSILGAMSFVACKNTPDDMRCDICRTNGNKVTVKAMEKAIARAKKINDDDPVEDLIEKMVVKYEPNLELCEDCADDKYETPEFLTSEQREQWNVKMKDILACAQESSTQRYAAVMELYSEYILNP